MEIAQERLPAFQFGQHTMQPPIISYLPAAISLQTGPEHLQPDPRQSGQSGLLLDPLSPDVRSIAAAAGYTRLPDPAEQSLSLLLEPETDNDDMGMVRLVQEHLREDPTTR